MRIGEHRLNTQNLYPIIVPLKCCYSPSGKGYLISGSSEGKVYMYSLAAPGSTRAATEKHGVPVTAVALNAQDTLLASADALGKVVLWRRRDE